MANNKKISEITVQATGGDLSGARYIAAVPDGGGGFSTKYVQGFGAGSAGGFIDQYYWTNSPTRPTTTVGTLTSVGLAGGTETNGFTNFNPDTQVVFYGLGVNYSSDGFPLTPGERRIFVGESGHNAKGFTLQSTGVVTQDNSSPYGKTTILTRFSRANLGGGGGGGFIDQIQHSGNATGTLANFDNNTQVVMAQAVSITGSSNFCSAQVQVPANNSDTELLSVGQASQNFKAKMRLNSDGSYSLSDTSSNHNFAFYITRYGKQ